MCLIFFSVNAHPTYKLIAVANRDEFYNRKTEPASYWKDHQNILGGRDLEAGGTWMGITRTGKISFVTNYRDLSNVKENSPSRGKLVSDYLQKEIDPEMYLKDIESKGNVYNGFNLVVGDQNELWYLSNYSRGIKKIVPGFYGLSNQLLETPWPKVTRGKEKLKPVLDQLTIAPDDLLNVLTDEARADDEKLPNTGIGLERERALSSMFIKSPGYGTRCSTAVLVDHSDNVIFTERVYDLTTFKHSTKEYNFKV